MEYNGIHGINGVAKSETCQGTTRTHVRALLSGAGGMHLEHLVYGSTAGNNYTYDLIYIVRQGMSFQFFNFRFPPNYPRKRSKFHINVIHVA